MSNKLKKITLIFPLILFITYQLTTTVADTDLWGYLSFGRLFWETNKFPYADVLSFVPTVNPWVYHEWLTGVIFYPLYLSLGSLSLQILKYILGIGSLGLIYLTAKERGASSLSAAFGVFLISGLFRSGFSPIRAQLFTYFFFALTLYLLEKTRRRSQWKYLLLLLPIQLLWANLHGGFIAGLGLIGLYALGETLSRQKSFAYWLILIAASLVTLSNPYGLDYWIYLLCAIAMPREMINEWLSVYQSFKTGGLDISAFSQFLLLNIFSIIWLVRWREITGGLALASAIYLGWKIVRHQTFFALLAGAYLPALIFTYFEDLKSNRRVIALSQLLQWPILMIFGIIISFFYAALIVRQDPLNLKIPSLPGTTFETKTYYPVSAVDYILEHNLSGRILIYFDWGEYAIWRLYPKCLVALDGRFETVYDENVTKLYFDFIYGKDNWQEFIITYKPDMILIPTRSKIYQLIKGKNQWQQVFMDSGSALFIKKDG